MKKLLSYLGVACFCSMSLVSSAQNVNISEIQTYLLEHDKDLIRDDVQNLVVRNQITSAHNEVTHVYAAQALNGIRIANSSLSAAFDNTGELRYVQSRFFSNIHSSTASPSITLKDAMTSQLLSLIPGLTSEVMINQGENDFKTVVQGNSYEHKGKGELVYFMTPENGLKLAWAFDCELPKRDHWFHYIVDATSGELLQKNDWQTSCTVDHFSTGDRSEHVHAPSNMPMPLSPLDGSAYRVFEFPIESPNHGSRTLASQPADALASPFGWHDTNGADGAEFTITRGNNVYAYEDQGDNNSPGVSPNGGENLLFDFPYDSNQLPENYTDAATTNLFYLNNRIHDILFVYGFDEAAGNFQSTNYSNNGIGDDFLNAECQDGEDFNNANMATPPDGSNPRMQMYLWQSGSVQGIFTVNSPTNLAGDYTTSSLSAFGPAVPAGGITANLALFEDEAGENTACAPAVNIAELQGKIVVVERGGCNFDAKVLAAQEAGAVACIIVNNQGGLTNPGGTNNNIVIPSFMILQVDGLAIISALEDDQEINATLGGATGNNFIDGSFDNGVVVHEYVHGLSNRLTGGSAEAGCLQNEEQMGEGWSDWYAVMITMDINAENPNYRPMGTFASDQPIDGNGIRPVPYDTSFAVNGYTYADLNNNEISVPHGVGFVWSTMLWDLTWAFVNEYGFDPDIINGTGGNNVVMQLVTDGLKLQPCSPGFVDGRDAILAADELTNEGANACLIWKTFAKRGLGYSADQGSTNSRADGTEAFDVPPACFNITAPPIAAFSANNEATCNGVIQFSDQSENLPQAWAWDFGDGETSNEQNPIHIYENEGVYSVSLTVINSLGEDNLIQTDLIDFGTPEAPSGVGANGCAGDTITLTANGSNGIILWTDEDNNEVGQGDNLDVVLGNQSISYFAQSQTNPQEPTYVGPIDEDFGSGGIHGTTFIGTVDFEAFQSLVIKSAYINSGGPGERVISLWDGDSQSGTLIDQAVVNIDFTGGGRIDLNLTIEVPGTYSMGLNQANLYRNDSGADYPYIAEGLMAITGSSAGPEFYYYLYDLEVEPFQCLSEATEVLAEVNGGSLFTVETLELTASFTATGASSNWNWNFGDGNTSTDQNPEHTYAESGVYSVTLTTDGGCEYGQSIEVVSTGIENYNSGYIAVSPIPADEIVVITNAGNQTLSRIIIRDIQGKIVIDKDLNSGNEWRINTSKIPTGIYALWILSEQEVPVYRQKVIVVH